MLTPDDAWSKRERALERERETDRDIDRQRRRERVGKRERVYQTRPLLSEEGTTSNRCEWAQHEGQVHELGLTFLCVPYSLDIGRASMYKPPSPIERPSDG